METKRPKPPTIQCLCGMKLSGAKHDCEILYRHLCASGGCCELYVEDNQLTLTDTPACTLVITPSIHVKRHGSYSRQYEIIGMGMLGQKETLAFYSDRPAADLAAEKIRGESG